MATDTVVLLNQKIHEGKRILVEDCSSSLMDVDFGIYPYTDSFNTTTGAVCTGLGFKLFLLKSLMMIQLMPP